jgi:uncharacterized lipoprotein YddW (UPF0748 family)
MYLNKKIYWLLLFTSYMVLFFGCRTTEPPQDEPEPETAVSPPDTEPKPDIDTETPDQPVLVKYEDYLKPRKEFRAVWVATVANIDWPSEPGLSVEQQKQEMTDILDRAASLHFNAIILQVRPAADALYNSPYEPWSYYLTGRMGQAPLPFYDPLEFAVQEAHKRGLELHAWFNPYRALHPTHKSEISPGHISKTNPGHVHTYGDFLWMDPGLPEVKEHTISVIMDVVKRYDIDGVHFDDYFYPYPSYNNGNDFPDEVSWGKALDAGNALSRADWRRNNVNTLMQELSEKIKKAKPHVKFGISPFGIWRPGFPEHTTGFDAYEKLYADARLWLQEGWVDYFTPQIYFQMDQVPQPFPVMLQWWADQNGHNRHLWPGLFTSRIGTTDITWPHEEITGQIYTSRGFPEVTGTVHFSMRAFLNNPDQFNQKLAAGPHSLPSLIPASPWMGSERPGIPNGSIQDYGHTWTLHLQPASDEDNIRWWVVRTKKNNRWEVEVIPGQRIETVFHGGDTMARPDKIYASAVNRIGFESEIVEVFNRDNESAAADTASVSPPQIIKRSEWAQSEPGGYDATAIRRNLSQGDTLQFRDLTVVVSQMLRSAVAPDHLFKAPVHGLPEEETERESRIIRAELFRNGVSESKTIRKGEAFNWYGYHIGLLDLSFETGLSQFEIATVASLPVDRAAFRDTGPASGRLRVPHRINKITLHHTGSTEPLSPDDDPKDVLQKLYSRGTEEQNWWDVPYHYLIDLDGTIYEGRDAGYAGDTNTKYDPRGHLLISLMGNYNLRQPTEGQIEAIASLAAYSIKKYGLSIHDIFGHDDWTDTSCPGEYLRPYLDDGTIRHLTEEKLSEE